MAGHAAHCETSRVPGSASAAVFVGCAMVALAACGGSGGPSHARPTSTPTHAISATPSAVRPDPQQSARAAVLTSYQAMWKAQVKAYAQASDKGTDLQKYATLDALGRALGDLQRLKAAHKVLQGAPQHSVTSIDLDEKLSQARINDCMDVSGWKAVTDQGKPLPAVKGALPRYVVTATAQKWGNRWMVTQLDPQQKPC